MAPGAEEAIAIEPVGRGRRLANYLIDLLAQIVAVIAVFVVVGLIGGEESLVWIEAVPDFVFGFLLSLAYYVPFEALTGRSVGKLITGTVVVNEDGHRPTLGQVFGRTFARIIPFEPFSFFRADARGWHDTMSKTYVVMKR